MNIVFFGTSEFAIPSLHEIINSRHKVLALVTQPDRKKGRNLKLSPPPTKVLASTKGVPVYQPEDASGPQAIEYLKKLNADLFVVVSFGQILKKDVLGIPKFCAINLHPSLLPKYRGAAPINWAVINGDKATGICIIRLNDGLDEGDIIIKRPIDIKDEETSITLGEELAEYGARILLEAIDLIGYGKAAFEKQDSASATYAPKLKKEGGLIDWSEPAVRIHNKIRGFMPWPGAYTYSGKDVLKIWGTEVANNPDGENLKNGEIADIIKGKGIVVHTGSGSLIIKHVQREGKNILDSDSFLRGYRIFKGHVFGR
jgi:methionyl-tRNA formyltransferase